MHSVSYQYCRSYYRIAADPTDTLSKVVRLRLVMASLPVVFRDADLPMSTPPGSGGTRKIQSTASLEAAAGALAFQRRLKRCTVQDVAHLPMKITASPSIKLSVLGPCHWPAGPSFSQRQVELHRRRFETAINLSDRSSEITPTPGL